MKQYSTLFLKVCLIIIGMPVLTLGLYGLYCIIGNPVNPGYAHILYPILTGVYLSTVPFYIALYQAYKLLCYIDANTAFSQSSIKALKNIKFCAVAIGILYVIILPFVYLLAQKDDAPGLIVFGMVPVFVSMVIAVFSAVLQMLLQDAIDIKSENDLTV